MVTRLIPQVAGGISPLVPKVLRTLVNDSDGWEHEGSIDDEGRMQNW